MTDQPEPFDLRSLDLAEARRQELLRLFPEIRTEGGKLDFERLKLALGEAVDVGKERYGMNWPGKADCFKVIQAPSLATLRPCPEESVNFATSENLIIEGDNLEVLKLLQKSYLGKVKLIYIDPPYNTGNDFIYPDNYGESMQTYLEYTGQVDAEGRKFGTNSDTDGRFHSKWLNMMYPRLYLARNLLRDDGVIFISIDDNEVDNLRKLGNEIFGEENFLASIVWEKVHTRKNSSKYFSTSHDYVLAYARAKDTWDRLLLPREGESAYRNPDGDPKGPWKPDPVSAHNPYSADYEIVKPNGVRLKPPEGRYWAFSEATWRGKVERNEVIWGPGASHPMIKRYLSEVQEGLVPVTLFTRQFAGDTAQAKAELDALLGVDGVMEYPKPSKLIRRLLQISTRPDDIVLDFFAGSGTTAHAVLDLNQQDGGNRKFILVQLPEPTDRADYPTIAEITKERVRRVIQKLNDEDAGKLPLNEGQPQDRGFRVFKLAESNFTPWNAAVAHDAQALAQQLELHIDHIRDGRTVEDLLYEILLKSGFPLTTPVETLTLAGTPVCRVAGGALLLCLEQGLTLELIRAMAEQKPERVVCLDEGFAGNDQLKANAVQIFKTKGVTSFKTV
jgi:adenine-specific DNA-methyltransferase